MLSYWSIFSFRRKPKYPKILLRNLIVHSYSQGFSVDCVAVRRYLSGWLVLLFVFPLRLIYLWGMEWEVLSQSFGFDVEIKIVSDVFEENCTYSITPGLWMIFVHINSDIRTPKRKSLLISWTDMNTPLKDFFSLDCCVECNAALVAEHYCEGEVYESAKIYVRKITDEHSKEDVQAILEVCIWIVHLI